MILGNSIYVSKSTETSGCRWLVALDELEISLAEGLLKFVCWLYVHSNGVLRMSFSIRHSSEVYVSFSFSEKLET